MVPVSNVAVSLKGRSKYTVDCVDPSEIASPGSVRSTVYSFIWEQISLTIRDVELKINY